MKNPDILEKEKAEILQKISGAVKNGDDAAFGAAFTEFAQHIQEDVMREARAITDAHDSAVLSRRGVRQLTSTEKKYYTAVAEAMKSGNPKQALTDLDVVLPETVINSVFDDLTENHPLLSAINFQNTGALVEFILSTSSGVAGWGDLTAAISDELSGSFSVMNLTLKKVSAFIPVAKSMLDLGPEWLDRYVRTILAEALAVQLEAAIVDGDGKDKPIGMTRALTGATDNVYPHKDTITVTALDPATIGEILNTISVTPNGHSRAIPSLLMVVNTKDYYTKVYPATTVRTTNGGFNRDVFPYPVNVVISAAVPEGKAVFGLASRYFFGLGTSKGGKIEYSDEYKFLEDQRVYLTKLYGNGRPLDEKAFVYADISGLTPYVQKVEVVGGSLPEG